MSIQKWLGRLAFLLILSLLTVGVMILADAQNRADRKAEPYYVVRVSNWVGFQEHRCHRSERHGVNYTLYDRAGNVMGEVTAMEGYVVTVRRRLR